MFGGKQLYPDPIEKPWSIGRHIGWLIGPIIKVVVAEQSDVRHENSSVHIDSVHRIEVVTAVSLRKVTVCAIEVPLPSRRAGVIARRGLGIEAELGHDPRANIVIVEIAANSKLRQLHFTRSEYFTRSADGVVFRMGEVVNVINVGSNFRRKEFAVESRGFRAWTARQPGPVRKCK